MHNISKKTIRDLAISISTTSDQTPSLALLDKARELYENAVLLHYQKPEQIALESDKTPLPQAQKEVPFQKENELSVQERIQQIMDSAPKFESETPLQETQEKPAVVNKPIPEEPIDRISPPTQDLEEEFKDAIAADYAADLFEKAEKIELTKKSLNDKLSQSQIQMGLNDRIAFVKHLFNGSQTDFNRVLSQLNSFHKLEQATQFINTMVKPEYNWTEKPEYEERFMLLVERKFL